MRKMSALDAMRSRLRPARTLNRQHLERLSAKMAPHVARDFLEEGDMIDAILALCEAQTIPVDIFDLAAIFLVRRNQDAYDLCFDVLTTGAKSHADFSIDFDRAVRLGRNSLGLPPHDRHL